tara:strand:+ start:1711 stop:2259 length:549 start_codon:yes stop_codon:yes gene_type:complete
MLRTIEDAFKQPHELRVIVWEAKSIKSEGPVDAMVSAVPLGLEKKTTDVHYFAKGTANFNWRMTWPVALPAREPSVVLDVFHQDPLRTDTLLGSATVDIKDLCDQVLKDKVGSSLDRVWVECMPAGRACVSIELLTPAEASERPATTLRAPARSPAEFASMIMDSVLDACKKVLGVVGCGGA